MNLEQFIIDGAVWAKNHEPMQRCYQTSYADIVQKRDEEEGLRPPCNSSLNNFVPFYFSPMTSMAYTIHSGNVSLQSPEGQGLGIASMLDIVFIVCDVAKISKAGLSYWFSDVACNSMALLPKYEDDLQKLDQHVDWALFNESPIVAKIPEIGYCGVCKIFKHFDEPKRYRNRPKKRMAEFLVKDALPLELVECIITKRDDIKDQLDTWLLSAGYEIPVYVKTGCYF